MNIEYLQPRVRVVNGVVSHRYSGDYADHAVIVNRAAGSDRDIAYRFFTHHASRGAELWVIDGMAASVAVGHLVAQERGLPVFIMGLRETGADFYRGPPRLQRRLGRDPHGRRAPDKRVG